MLNATRFLNQATVTPSQSKKAAAIVQWILPAGGTARIVGSDGANVRKRTVSCTAGYLFLGGKGRGRGNQVSSQEKKRHTPQRTSRWRALSTQGQRCNRNYFFVRHMRLHSVPSGLFIVRKRRYVCFAFSYTLRRLLALRRSKIERRAIREKKWP